VESPSLDPFTLFDYYRSGNGGTMCLTTEQFDRLKTLGKPVGDKVQHGAGNVSFYDNPFLKYSFGTATMFYREGQAVGFRDIYDFNLKGRREQHGTKR
jgi:hypothetical protein